MNTQTSLVAEQVRLNQWAEQIKACQSRPAGMKIETWCADNGITKANYYYRLRRVREACLAVCESSEMSFVEVPKLEPTVPDTTAAGNNCAAVLHIPNGMSVEIFNGASSELIKNVMGALGYAQ